MADCDILQKFFSIQHENVERLFQCKLCQKKYSSPKILPECGHSFCLKCMSDIKVEDGLNDEDVKSIECPDCKVESKLETGSLENDLKTNIALQRAMDVFYQNGIGQPAFQSNECPHQFLTSLIECEHCSKTFCDACIFRHMELLKMEIEWTFSSLKYYIDEFEAENVVPSRKRRHCDSKNCNCDTLVRKSNYSRTFLECHISSEEKMCLFETAVHDNTLTKRVDKMNETSLLFTELPDLVVLHRDVLAKESETAARHNGTKKVLPLPQRLHAETIAGNFKSVQAIIEMPNLPPYCQEFVIKHRDPDDCFRTLLHQAAMHGHLAIVKWLIQTCKMNAKVRDHVLGAMPIHQAAYNGKLEVIKFFLDFDPQLLEAETACDGSMTPLCFACLCPTMAVVEYLINKGAKINSLAFTTPPLQSAIYRDDLHLFKFLVEKGADLRALDYQREKPIIHYAVSQSIDFLKYILSVDKTLLMLENSTGNQFIHQAACEPSEAALQFFIEELGCSANARNRDDETPLHCAACAGSLRCTSYLARKGADMTAYRKDGMTALHLAAMNNHLDVVKELVKVRPELMGQRDCMTGITATTMATLFFQENKAVINFLQMKSKK